MKIQSKLSVDFVKKKNLQTEKKCKENSANNEI